MAYRVAHDQKIPVETVLDWTEEQMNEWLAFYAIRNRELESKS